LFFFASSLICLPLSLQFQKHTVHVVWGDDILARTLSFISNICVAQDNGKLDSEAICDVLWVSM